MHSLSRSFPRPSLSPPTRTARIPISLGCRLVRLLLLIASFPTSTPTRNTLCRRRHLGTTLREFPLKVLPKPPRRTLIYVSRVLGSKRSVSLGLAQCIFLLKLYGSTYGRAGASFSHTAKADACRLVSCPHIPPPRNLSDSFIYGGRRRVPGLLSQRYCTDPSGRSAQSLQVV